MGFSTITTAGELNNSHKYYDEARELRQDRENFARPTLTPCNVHRSRR